MLSLVNTLEGHTERVWHCSWSPDGTKLASCGEDKTIRIWMVEAVDNVRCIATLEEGQSRTIRSCEWSPDGKMIASASFDGTVVVWQTVDKTFRNWDQVASLEGHENEVKSISWSYDGLFLASCGRDKKVWVWERLRDGEFECVAMLEGHSQDVKFVMWLPGRYEIVSASYDDTVKFWRGDNDDWFCVQTLKGHTSTVWGVAVDNKATSLVSCSDDKSIILWTNDNPDKSNWQQMSRIKDLHSYAIYSVDWKPESSLIATAGGDNNITVCSRVKSDGSELLQTETVVKNAHEGDVNCIRWNPNIGNPHLSDVLVTASDDCLVKMWKYCV